MLRIENLTVNYNRKPVLENIQLDLAANQLHGLVGLNGAGKTTLLNAVYGFIKPDSGQITFNNKKAERKLFAYLESTQYFYPHTTGNDYLDLFCSENKSFGKNHWNKLFALPLDELIETYSSGMKKKLALMGVIALNREIILLDEPFNTLDLEAVELLKHIIPQLRDQGKTILVTSHILETLTDTCNEIHYLRNGKIENTFLKHQFSDLTVQLKELTETQYREWFTKTGNGK